MKKILIATSNPGKVKEIKLGLLPFKNQGITLLTLNDVGVEKKPTENGKTFKENSLIKAQFYGNLTGLPTIADDGGLIIPYLNNEPGVKSRRWPGYEASDNELIDYCFLHLRGVTGVDRMAYLVVNLCFFDPKTNKTFFQEEKIKGRIANVPSKKRMAGYPFRTLFIVDKFKKYYDELTEKEHQIINHRLKAIKKLSEKIIKYLLK